MQVHFQIAGGAERGGRLKRGRGFQARPTEKGGIEHDGDRGTLKLGLRGKRAENEEKEGNNDEGNPKKFDGRKNENRRGR